ncbi:hypothetical protein DFH28DRAFT_883411 [Melampsora americana]|nr:hypothetical protein DFH28DRAFT_883411 [Melampsora americana]
MTGHSFRIGGATLLTKAGVNTESVKTLGCWKSSCHILYQREWDDKEWAAAKRILDITGDRIPRYK